MFGRGKSRDRDHRDPGGGHAEKDPHAGHSHEINEDADKGKLTIALVLLGSFLAAEVVAGIVANSLALLSDAAHMLTDTAAIAFALIAINLTARKGFVSYTFGLKRSGILAAAINGLTLAGLGLYLGYEGIHRLIDPPEVEGLVVVIVGFVGIAVNVAASWTLAQANRDSLNVEGAFQHVLNDLYAFIGTTVAGIVILFTGWGQADGIAALVISALMLKSGIVLIRESTRVFLEAAPRGIEPPEVRAAMLDVNGISGIQDFHVWEVTSGFPSLSAHVTVSAEADRDDLKSQLKALLDDRFGIDHVTLQMDLQSVSAANSAGPFSAATGSIHSTSQR